MSKQEQAVELSMARPRGEVLPLQLGAGALCRVDEQPKQGPIQLFMVPEAGFYEERMRGIEALRCEVYSRLYPEVKGVDRDPYDRDSCVIYSQGTGGEVTSTARIAFDGARGVPEAPLVPDLVGSLRSEGTRFAELGRFVIGDGARGVLPNYYRAFYELGLRWGIELYLMFVPENKVSLYRRLMDATVCRDLGGLTFGSRHRYLCMAWRLERTRSRFFSWCGAVRSVDESCVEEADQ